MAGSATRLKVNRVCGSRGALGANPGQSPEPVGQDCCVVVVLCRCPRDAPPRPEIGDNTCKQQQQHTRQSWREKRAWVRAQQRTNRTDGRARERDAVCTPPMCTHYVVMYYTPHPVGGWVEITTYRIITRTHRKYMPLCHMSTAVTREMNIGE